MNMLLQKLKALYHRYPLITSLSVLILFGATVTFATPPVSPYTPGETLDPSCAPGDTNCTVTIIPDQTGNSGKYLTTNGTVTSWATVSGSSPIYLGTSGNTLYTSGLGAGEGHTTFGNNIFFGDSAGSGATSASYSNFLGQEAGSGATSASYSNFLGQEAGSGATSAFQSNFLGQEAGSGATSASYSNFFGFQAGFTAINSPYSNFLGNTAGHSATNASRSNFFGLNAGHSATNASRSNFFGLNAGYGATNAANSIFLGAFAGSSDTVDNTQNGTDDSSILIGNYTNTGGFSNSILLGSGTSGVPIANTAANQFMLADTITNVRLRGIEYTLPSVQGTSGQVLRNNGSGALTWASTSLNGLTNATQTFAVSASGTNFAISSSGTTHTFAIPNASASATRGLLTSANWTTFNNKENALTFSGPLSRTGDTISITQADGSTDGYLSSTDWNTFNDKVSSPISIGTSGNTLYTPGLGAGQGETTDGQNIFFGTSAGSGATNATYSNFFGYQAGQNATNATYSNFFGQQAGQNASSVSHSNFLGTGAGLGATSAEFSNFFGNAAGNAATGAANSNFFGQSAGYNATNAVNSNFFGNGAGNGATDAGQSNFFGNNSGNAATNAFNSNFFNENAGYNATDASYSNFFGFSAGASATNAAYSNFFGENAGSSATDASGSNFFGLYAGVEAVSASRSNFIGSYAGSYASNATYSNFLGYGAGAEATNATNSIFLGRNAGYQDTVDNTLGGSSILVGSYTNTGGFSNSILLGSGTSGVPISNTKVNQFMLADTITDVRWSGVEYTLPSAQAGGAGYVLSNDGSGVLSWEAGGGGGAIVVSGLGDTLYSASLGAGEGTGDENIFIGLNAGIGADNASKSIFFGKNTGLNAVNVEFSNFLGHTTGFGATNASFSNFLGSGAGLDAIDASHSNFFGQSAGSEASSATNSNFFGQGAGTQAVNASYSNFFGYGAGSGAVNAKNSIIIGSLSGFQDAVDNTAGGWSILLGSCLTTGGFSNSVLIGGGSLSSDCNTATQFQSNTAANQFMLADSITNVRFAGVEYTLPSAQAGGADYVLVNDSTGILSWADPSLIISDETLKSNIVDLGNDTLSKLSQVRTVSYVLNADKSQRTQIGFLAQDLELYFPELVGIRSDNYKAVYYAQMTAVLTKAVQELNLKLTAVDTFAFEDTGGFAERLRQFFETSTNGIRKIFVKEVQTDRLCVGTTCVTESQLQQLLNQSGQSGNVTTPSPEPEVVNSEGDTPEETIPSEGSVPQEEIVPEPTPEPVPETVPEPIPEVVTQSEPPTPTE